jgi:N-acetylglutamate synthase-like GNAT family acetyltransferase
VREPTGVVIESYAGQSADLIFDLILPIQREEFGLPVRREDQPDLEQISGFYQTGQGGFWLAKAGDELVGSIALKDIGDGQVALRKMFVRADFRGGAHGVANRLLDAALSWSRDKAVTAVYLGTTPFFHAAHRFYEKNGFTEIAKSELPQSFPIMSVDTKFYRLRLG